MHIQQILKDLITFKTYEGNEKKAEQVDGLFKYVLNQAANRYKYKEFESNGHKSLVIYRNKLSHAKVVLQAHVDVVPGDDHLFEPIQKDGVLYGRGAFDMKFAVACYIKLLNDLEDREDLDIAVWITSDEEIGGFDGVHHLLNELDLSCDCVFLPDGGTGLSIVTNAKGLLHFTLESRGLAGHASRPWEGDNALDKVISAYNKIKSSDFFRIEDENNTWRNTINLGKVVGGNARNSIPENAEAHFDVRFLDNDQLDEIEKFIKSVAKAYDLIYERHALGNAYSVDSDNEYYKDFIRIIDESNIGYTIARDHGSSDVRHFAQKGIPAIMFMPEGGGGHSDDEWVNVHSLEKFFDVLKEFVVKNG